MLNVTPADDITAQLKSLADGDALDATNFLALAQPIANRIEALIKRLGGAAVGDIVPVPLNPLTTDITQWQFAFGVVPLAVNQASVVSAYGIYFELPQPKLGVLKDLTVRIAGASGHVGLPGTMPTLKLYRQDGGSTGAPVQVGATITDTSATTGAYELVHPLTITGLTEAMSGDSGNRYYILVTGEAGANSVAGLAITDIVATIDPS